jgi:hypothetical protein
MGMDPAGWTLGSAAAGATVPMPMVPTTSAMDAARAVVSLAMGDTLTGVPRPRRAVLNRPMMSLAEISDRLEIQQLVVDYATAIDQRKFDDLDAIFTPDAYIDYRVMGGIDGVFPEVKAWLAEVLPGFPAYYHLVGNFDIRVSGDTATGRTMCFNPMKLNNDGQILLCALWYDDEFIRTAQGWRMTRRVETKCMDKTF